MATYKVREGWQIKHEGKMYHGGDVIEGTPRQADVQKWLGAGLVDEVKESKASKEPESKHPATPSAAAKKTTSRGDA